MSPEGSIITEGGTRILVPQLHSTHGPGKKIGPVFFNEQMSFNRDVSVMLLRALERDRIRVKWWQGTGKTCTCALASIGKCHIALMVSRRSWH